MQEGARKGVAYFWSNLKLNPIREWVNSGIGIIKDHKRLRNTIMFGALSAGMVGGCALFVFSPELNEAIAAMIEEGLSIHVDKFIIEALTGFVGLMVGGAIAGNVTKQVLRGVNWQVGGDTNSEYVLTENQLDNLLESSGLLLDEETPDLSFSDRGLMKCTSCLPIDLIPNRVQQRLLDNEAISEDKLRARENVLSVLYFLKNLKNRYKHDGTKREHGVKHPISEMLKGRFMPVVEFLTTKRNQAKRRQDEAEDLVHRLDGMLGDEPHNVNQSAELEEIDQIEFGQFLDYYKNCTSNCSRYNLHPKKFKSPKVRTYGELEELRTLAKLQAAKQDTIATDVDTTLSRIKPGRLVAL